MQAIVSLERFNCMSENAPDEFAESVPEQPGNDLVSAPNEMTPPAEQSQETAGETPGPETSEAQPEASPIEQTGETTQTAKPEDALPPEAQGEANGGPLGCCLGMMVGLLLSLSLAVLSRAYATTIVGSLQGNYGLLGLVVRILMGILAVALAIFFGYLGWRLGKRFYREYDPPVRKSRSKSRKMHQKA